MWIAYNPFEAGRLWKMTAIRPRAAPCLNFKKKSAPLMVLATSFLPGRVGFEKNGLVKLNPSYYPLFILKRFALEDAYWKSV